MGKRELGKEVIISREGTSWQWQMRSNSQATQTVIIQENVSGARGLRLSRVYDPVLGSLEEKEA